MAEDRISELFDVANIEKEFNDLISKLSAKLKAFPSIRVNLDGSESLQQYTKATKDLAKAQRETISVTDQLKQKNIELRNAKLELALQSAKEAKDSKTANQQRREEIALSKASAKEQKDVAKAVKDATSARVAERKLIEQASNEYFNLNKALSDAELKYKNLALTQGFMAKQTQVALKEAVSLRNVLNKVDQSLGNYQRNVGNYGSAFNGLGNSVQQILREAPSVAVSLNTFFLAISNNLPILFDEISKVQAANKLAAAQALETAAAAAVEAEAHALAAGAASAEAKALGELASAQALANANQVKAVPLGKQLLNSLFSINTLLTVGVLALTLYGGKLVELAKKFFAVKQSVSEFATQQKLLATVFEGTAKAAGEEIGKLRVLRDTIEATTVPMKARLDAIKEIKELYPKYFEGMKTEDLLAGNLAASYDLATKAIIRKAMANAAAAKIESLTSEKLQTLFDSQLKLEEANKKIREAKSDAPVATGGTLGGGNFGGVTKAERQRTIREEYNLEKKAAQDKIDLANKQINFLLQLVRDGAEERMEIDKKDKKGRSRNLSDLQKELNNEFEINKIHQQRKIKIAEDIMADDRISYDEKLIALEDFNRATQELLLKQEQFEILAAQRETAREIANLQKDKKGKSKEQEARINENIAIQERNLIQTVALIQKKAADDSIQLARDTEAKRRKINDDRLKVEKEFMEQRLKLEEELNDKILKIQEKLRDDIEKLELNDLENSKRIADIKAQFHKDAVLGVIGVFNAALDAQEQRQQEQFDRDIARIDARSQAEIEAINASGMADAEKERLTLAIQKQAAFEKERLDAKKAASEKKYQQIKKFAAVAEIGVNTALALFDVQKGVAFAKIQAAKFAAMKNPVGAAIALAQIPVMLSTIPGIMAGAALSLAKVAFFKHGKGKDNNYEGLAVVGDGGKREPILRADGSLELSPAKDTLTYIARNDMVFPDIQSLLKAVHGNELRGVPDIKIAAGSSHDPELKNVTRLLKEINNKSRVIINNHAKIETTAWYQNNFKN